MRKIPLLTALAAIGAVTCAGPALAQSAPPLADQIKAGQLLATKGAGDAVPACESCHGEGAGEFPLLAGDAGFYIFKQLTDFRSGKREDPLMSPIAKALKPAQIEAAAAYFASLPRKKSAQPATDAAVIARGKVMAEDGDSNRDIFPCDRCHGTRGMGGDFVGLGGQNPEYVIKQVQALRAGTRSNDELGIMQAIAKKLTDDEIRAVAAYYSQTDLSPLPPPPPPKKRN